MYESVAVVGAHRRRGDHYSQVARVAQISLPRDQVPGLQALGGQDDYVLRHAHTVEELRPEAFDGVQLAIASTPDDVARDFIPAAVARGCVVIDESGYWRMDPKVPLVIPEVNPARGQAAPGHHLQPQLLDHADGPGPEAAARRRPRAAGDREHVPGDQRGRALRHAATSTAQPVPCWPAQDYKCEAFAHPIAFNCIPQIGSPKHQGYTSEEMKMVLETRKMLEDDTIQVCPTCVRVPVANCHSESILVETQRKISVDEARRLFAATPGLVVLDDLEKKIYPMPLNADDRDETFIGRIREDLSSPNGLAFWCVSDNLRKGAATNAVQIAELLVKAK